MCNGGDDHGDRWVRGEVKVLCVLITCLSRALDSSV